MGNAEGKHKKVKSFFISVYLLEITGKSFWYIWCINVLLIELVLN